MDWERLRKLLASRPKPPIGARVVELRDGRPYRRATVLHDGRNRWCIEVDDPDRGRSGEYGDGSRTLLLRGEEWLVFPTDEVCANTWVKSLVQGSRLASLDAARGRVLGEEERAGRPSWVADVEGLRAGEDVAFRMVIDAATGVTVELRRLAPPDRVLRLEDPIWDIEVRDRHFGWWADLPDEG